MALANASASPVASANTTVTQSWGAYGPETVVSGSFHIAPNGAVSGTLPPGYSKAHPPVDAAAPETAEKIRNAPATSALTVLSANPAAVIASARKAAPKARAASNPAGCVTAISYIDSGGLGYKGQMAGCAYGNPLWLHTYLNANGVRVAEYPALNCYATTSCSVPYDKYAGAPNCREFINYAHGINRTTGGDDTAYSIHDSWAC